MDLYELSNLTRAQFLLWVGQKMYPEVPLYNAVHTFTFHGDIDPGQFREAFQLLVDRADALRTVFFEDCGVPRQRVLSHLLYSLDYLDFSGRPDPEEATMSWAAERRRLRLNLEERAFDSALIKLGSGEYVWYLCQHHIICDAWSMSLVFRKTGEIYAALTSESDPQAIVVPSYQDFVESDAANRRSKKGRIAEAYWKQKLEDVGDSLMFYGRRGNALPARAVRVTRDLGEHRSSRLRALAQRSDIFHKNLNVTLTNMLVTSFAAWLHRVCDSETVSVGMPYHNRETVEFKETPGLFIEVLPLRNSMESRDTFLTLMQKVQIEVAENLKHRPYSLQNRLDAPAYDVMFSYQVAAFGEFAGQLVQQEYIHPGYANERVVLHVHDFDRTGRLHLHFDFDVDIFDQTLRERAVNHFLTMLDAFLDNPNRCVSEVDLLTEEERRLLSAWNDTAANIPDTGVVHELFEEWVVSARDATAVSFDGVPLSYAELNRRANQLAHYLRRRGVRPDALVGLCVERSIDMVVGVLGVLKSGAAYLPLDPLYPRDRLAFMIQDACVPVLLTQQALRLDVPLDACHVISLDTEWPMIAESCADNPPLVNAPSDLAYVIYTSGSTGRPKGVAMPHRALVNLVRWQTAHSKASVGTKTLQFAPLSFDVSFQEMFCTWASGGTLVLIDNETRRDSRQLLDTIAKGQVERLFVPYVALRGLAQAAVDTSTFPGCLKEIITAGEQLCITPPIRTFFSILPACQLVNQYGPTESHVVSAYVLSGAPDEWPALPPIGRPIHNTTLYVLNGALEPVPIGVPGELYIGGEGVARGYWNRPNLTEERFVPNPLNPHENGRLYRTGDIVRYSPDGNIEFLGRLDHQAKIRGFRIEPGEIESVLCEHPGVEQAAVVAREDGAGGMRLVAHVVVSAKNSPHGADGIESALRSYVQEKLPDYMVPSAFVRLDAFPLNPNGKVDRAALPTPEVSRLGGGQHRLVLARDPAELKLTQIWEHVFGSESLAVTDNFRELGGHSLLAVVIVEEIQRHFGVRLPVLEVFNHPTIQDLAGVLRNGIESEEISPVVPLKPHGEKTPFFCVHPAPGTVFTYMELSRYLDAAQPFYGLQAPKLYGGNWSCDSVESMASSYVEAIQTVQRKGPYMLGGHSSGALVAFEMAQQLTRRGEKVGLFVSIDSPAPLVGAKTGELLSAYFEVVENALWLAYAATIIEVVFDTKLDVSYSRLRTLTLEEQFESVTAEIIRAGVVPPGTGSEYIQRVLDVSQTSIDTLRRYKASLCDFDLALFYTTVSPIPSLPRDTVTAVARTFFNTCRQFPGVVARNLLGAALNLAKIVWTVFSFQNVSRQNALGWQRLCTRPVWVREVPGNHLTMLSDPHVKYFARELQECLDRAYRNSSSSVVDK